MMELLIYGLKVTLLLLLFGAFYRGVLLSTPLGHFKRAYLLLALVFAHLFPLLPVHKVPGPSFPATAVALAPVAGSAPASVAIPTPAIPRERSGGDLDVGHLLGSIYIIGLFFAGRRFVLSIRLLAGQLRRGSRQRYGRAYLVELPGRVAPHTFGRWIFVDADHPPAPAILAHEYAHAIQGHTLDRLFIAALRTLCWFNPLLYYYERAILFNHEYLADRAVLRRGFAPQEYQYRLLATLGRPAAATRLASGLDFHFTKKRLQMMLLPSASPARTTLVWSLTLGLGLVLLWSFGRTTVIPVEEPSGAGSQSAPASVTPSASDVVPLATSFFAIQERSPRQPTAEQLSVWHQTAAYGVWIDGQRVENAELAQFAAADFSFYSVSRSRSNARNYGELDYEVNLTTNATFQRNRYQPNWQGSSCRWEPAPAREDC